MCDPGDDSTIHSTGVDTRLNEMMDILCREEEERNPHDPGTMVTIMGVDYIIPLIDTCTVYGNSCSNWHSTVPECNVFTFVVCATVGSMYGVCIKAQDSRHTLCTGQE